MSELLEIAVKAARSAGDEIMKHYDSCDVSRKEDGSPLTSADLAANDALFFWLERTGYPVCSEERLLDYKARGGESTFWLVDPLDGTKDFIEKKGEFCVCVALIERARPVLSVIYIPVSREIYYSAGNGVYKNDRLLKPTFSGVDSLICGNSGHTERAQALANVFGLNIKRCGSAIKFCRLIEGNAGVYARFGDSYLWDIAAGDFLVTQAGGMMVGLENSSLISYDSEDLRSDYFIAVNAGARDRLSSYLDYIYNSNLNKRD